MSSLINSGLTRISYENLSTKAQAIHDGLVANVADYPAPNPTMPDFQLDIDALNSAIVTWGPPEARGSRAQHDALVTMANIVKNDLRMLAAYAMNTQPNNPDSWRACGFGVKRAKSAPLPLEVVRDFHQFVSRKIADGFIKLKWKRPLDTDPADVKGYIIQYSDSPVQPLLKGTRPIVNIFKVQTQTSIIVEPPFVGANYFWVTAFNSVGYGVSSEAVYFNNPGKVTE